MLDGDTLGRIALTALAGCLGWGIRGVFGGQNGAMVPGALMGAALATGRLGTHAVLLAAVGAAAWSIGGVMTYGQTLGLVHNEPRPKTYWWGLLGCFVKGGLWFGLAGALLGLAATGDLWDAPRTMLLAAIAGAAGWLGKRILNAPLDPPNRYPRIYFSRRAQVDLDRDRPRDESWGGLLFGLIAVLVYGYWVWGNTAAVHMAAFGLIGGGFGFAIGEMLQAWGKWRRPFGDRVQEWVDWWKVMEMSFGLIGGAAIGTGWALLDEPGGIPPHWDAPVEACVALLWLVPLVMAAHGLRPAGRLANLPVLPGMVIIAGVALGGLTPFLLVLCFLFYISGLDTLQRWRRELGPQRYLWWNVGLAVAALGWTMLCTLMITTDPQWFAPVLLLLLGGSQTALTFIKALGERDTRGLRPRLRAMGAALPVEASFVVLTVGIYLLARAL